eukprot:CAMPEP_0194540548 /NCGR_PEP_ID=MMETSP0253-20130528/80782_1 /TAXON_ID=2966 /ORGANISM="Noctiluca scintillans" /LENGTH=94 /DNA_ID=CAMNT_0039386927 /DNA_START=275 /DNA_END=559 /DNA_ORIENTATION=-
MDPSHGTRSRSTFQARTLHSFATSWQGRRAAPGNGGPPSPSDSSTCSNQTSHLGTRTSAPSVRPSSQTALGRRSSWNQRLTLHQSREEEHALLG